MPPLDLPAPKSNMGGMLVQYLNNEEFSDLKILTGEDKQVIFAHKVILKYRSSVLSEVIKNLKEDILEIPQYSYDVMLAVLRYVYSGVVDYKPELAKDVSKAAKEYNIRELEVISGVIVENGYYNSDLTDLRRRQDLLLNDMANAFGTNNRIQDKDKNYVMYDVVIHAGNETIYSHKVILASRSEQLKKLIQESNDNEITLETDFLKQKIPGIFRLFFSWLYGELRNVYITVDKVLGMIEIGEMYGCPPYMKQNLEYDIYTSVNGTALALDILEQATFHKQKTLKKIGIYYCAKYYKNIRPKIWKSLPLSSQNKIKSMYDEYSGKDKCGLL